MLPGNRKRRCSGQGLAFVPGGDLAAAAGFRLQDMPLPLSYIASRSIASTATAVKSRG